MSNRCTIAVVLFALTGIFFPPSVHRSTVLAQQKPIGQLSVEQRRAVQVLISTNGIASGLFSSEPIAEKATFRVAEEIHLGTLLKNTAAESVNVCAFSNPYYQNRPQLTRDGETLGYSAKIAELVRQSDQGLLCIVTRTPDIVELKPNVPFRVPSIRLQDWYEPLTPGRYKLLLRRTFACCADRLLNSSNEISFEVIP